MNKQQALDLVNQTTSNKNLVKHMLAVGVCMKALAHHFGEDEQKWEVVGIVHDGTYEKDPQFHPISVIDKISDLDEESKYAIKAHGWGHIEGCPEPKSNLDWSLYCVDGLTGLITTVALVRPSKKIADVKLKSIKKKWKQKAFAAGADREQIAMCETKLDIPLDEFITICLTAMQEVSEELGL